MNPTYEDMNTIKTLLQQEEAREREDRLEDYADS